MSIFSELALDRVTPGGRSRLPGGVGGSGIGSAGFGDFPAAEMGPGSDHRIRIGK